MPDDGEARTGISVLHAVAFIVGIVIGIGIFKSPQLVAQNVTSAETFIALWIAGGLVTLVGALVYAELASAHPSGGGEYFFLSHALGQPVGLLFAWARVTVIQTGAIAAVAFVYGDYAQALLPLGARGPAIHAAFALTILTLLNVLGSPHSKSFQLLMTSLTMVAILSVAAAGLWMAPMGGIGVPAAPAATGGAFGLAMIFVLLTYGGWNEAAYLSAEIKDAKRNMVRVLLIATGSIMSIYLVLNLAYLSILGLDGIRQSSAVGADAMRAATGDIGATALAFAVCFAALSTLNGIIFTGARLYQAVGSDLPALRRLSLQTSRDDNPVVAILVQAAVAMSLIAFGALTRDGFQAMVEYTAPVFWLFLLLVGISLFVLRWREPDRERPFRVPLYPLTPVLFCLTCAYLFYSSLADTGLGALVGIVVLLAGVPVVWLALPRNGGGLPSSGRKPT